jgi:Ni,Fe-hydrogenase III large subunit/NADH:ubiquinone oxidoreductase subunit C
MGDMKYYKLINNPGIVTLSDIPALDYQNFREQTLELLKNESCHCVNYFTHQSAGFIDFYILIANDDSHNIYVYLHRQKAEIKTLESITKDCFQLHVFEREIHEKTGVIFDGHPWLKPIRYPFDRNDKSYILSDYPFYRIESEEIHEVGVGPIHAGIIEPGHFRFQCYGEKVLHLEVQLGYQHRGIESLFMRRESLLQRSVICESIAGDTAIGHGLAFVQLAETVAGTEYNEKLEIERVIALEMERIAIHIGDTAALCGDVAYQIGQVACEALRTIIINTMQEWCGNRFGKGLIRPGGTNYPLNKTTLELIYTKLMEVHSRFMEVTDMVYNDSGILARFENTGVVSARQAYLSGAVGMAARSTGICRDIRKSHPFQAYKMVKYKPALLQQGDVYARALLRKLEFDLSFSIINDLKVRIENLSDRYMGKPVYKMEFAPGVLCVSLVEGWRGEICHVMITDEAGKTNIYKIKDPSLHNWHVLALAVRGQEISDFPVCNKSFNLSYCGNDL